MKCEVDLAEVIDQGDEIEAISFYNNNMCSRRSNNRYFVICDILHKQEPKSVNRCYK